MELRSAFVLLGLCALTAGGCSSKKGGAGGASGAGGATGGDAAGTGGGRGGTGGRGGAGGGGGAQDAGLAADARPEACGDPVGPTANESTDPSACTNKVACAPGLLCGGLNCDTPWICFSHDDDDLLKHPCPGDMAEYCGCDGVTFEAFNTCPDRPFEHWGACGDGVNCNPEDLRCALTEPTCPEGMIASVVKGSYGPCVPFAQCRCEFGWQCPHGDTYTCDATAHRCGPKPSPDAGQDASDQSDAAPRFSGVDPSKRLDGLTPDEQKTVCDYKASYYGGYGMTVQCGLGFVLISEDSQDACLAAWPTVCAVSVAQLEQCFNDRTCAHPTPPSCDALLPCHN